MISSAGDLAGFNGDFRASWCLGAAEGKWAGVKGVEVGRGEERGEGRGDARWCKEDEEGENGRGRAVASVKPSMEDKTTILEKNQ